MDIILLQDVEKVGDKHEVITVKPGYGRNFLIPKGLAVLANKTNMEKLEVIQRREAAEADRRRSEFEEIAERLKGQVLKIGAKAGTSGKIFGSVTQIQIAQALQEQMDIEVERRKVVMPDEVKSLGTYTASLKLHPEVDSTFQFEVVSE